MAWENSLALDTILAKKGGVSCWMYIPNNTAPDETISKALQGLTTLSKELAENLGIMIPSLI
jgi:hypothetical protein